MKKEVLLVEDDDDLRNVLSQYLQVFDFKVTTAQNGEEAIELFTINTYDLCVFDVMMPKMDGFTLAQKVIEKDPEASFVFLTARNLKEDKLKGLRLGADDYIEKPFEADELVLRLNNILKRRMGGSRMENSLNKINIGNYELDCNRLTLKSDDQIENVTKRESELIQYLFKNKNEVVRREDILKHVWGNGDFFSGRSMDVFVSRLRKYFKNDPSISIESKRGIGLEFRVS